MRLQILVPHYKETAGIIRPLLDSIAIQQNADFSEVGVIICHDGPEAKDFCFTDNLNLVEDGNMVLPDYPFLIEQIRQDHKGVSAARNTCLDAATADYVMFCDADDMFSNVCGLWVIFREIAIGFDSMITMFVEETRNQFNDVVYVNHEMDSTFVHGKIHRRQYLIDKQIRWNEKLTIHEDSFFNILCQSLSTNVKYCNTPIYLWKWRNESVCRHDPKYILKTYSNLIDSNDATIDEFVKRGIMERALFHVITMIFDAYYTMNKPDWVNQENKEYRDSTEQHFAAYYKKRKDMWKAVSMKDKMAISNQVRARSINDGMLMEAITVDDWLKHIEKLGRKR